MPHFSEPNPTTSSPPHVVLLFADQGVGEAFLLDFFYKQNARIWLVGESEANLLELCKRYPDSSRLVPFAWEATAGHAAQELAHIIEHQWKTIDVLVHCGVPAEEADEDLAEANPFTGPLWQTLKPFIRLMMSRGGHLLLFPAWAMYGAGAAHQNRLSALAGFIRLLATDLAQWQVACNVVHLPSRPMLAAPAPFWVDPPSRKQMEQLLKQLTAGSGGKITGSEQYLDAETWANT